MEAGGGDIVIALYRMKVRGWVQNSGREDLRVLGMVGWSSLIRGV